MSKPIFGLLLGGFLGVFDGMSAWFSAPEVRPQIVGIVIGSTFKGLVAGVLVGWFARKVRSLPLGIVFGLLMGAFFAFLVAMQPNEQGGHYWWEIMLPGSILGMIVGYATQKHGGRAGAPVMAAAIVLCAGSAMAADAPAGSARQALDRLKTLVGTWEGSVGGPTGPAGSVRYELTAGGHSVVERLFPGTDHEMMTVYHLDGDALLATHYCAMGNQPVMKLEKATAQELSFGFAGGTNLDAQKDVHIHAGRLRFVGEGKLESEWDMYEGGKRTGSNTFFLKRRL